MEIQKLSPEQLAELTSPRTNTTTAKIRALEVGEMLVFLPQEKGKAESARVLAWRLKDETGREFSFRKREWGGFLLVRVS